MGLELLLFVGVDGTGFVGFDVGDSSTGVAFDRVLGYGVVPKLAVAPLFSAFPMIG